MSILKKFIIKTRDLLALLLLLIFYHGYEVFCYIVSNTYQYYLSVLICAFTLFCASLSLVYLHDWLLSHFSWDALKLQYLNSLRGEDNIPSYQVFRKLTRFVLRHGFWAIVIIGPVILGPFIITVLLRQRKTWRTTSAYTLSGSLINALFWVGLMRGLGVLTWGYLSIVKGKYF